MAQPKYLFIKDSSYGTRNYDLLQSLPDKVFDTLIKMLKDKAWVDDIRRELPALPRESIVRCIPYVLSDNRCVKCDSYLYKEYERTNDRGLRLRKEICFNCHHEEKEGCTCKYCWEEYLEIIDEFCQANSKPPVDITELSIYDKVQIMILAKRFSRGADDFYFGRSYGCFYGTYYKTSHELTEIVDPMIERGIFKVARNHNRELINLEEKSGSLKEYYLIYRGAIHWELNLQFEGKPIDAKNLANAISALGYSPLEKSNLWRMVYKEHLSQYIRNQAGVLLKMDFSELLFDFITDSLIEEYSLSQAFALAYSAISSTMRYVAKYTPSKNKVTANFRNNILRYMQWYTPQNTRHFNRPANLKISYISSVILNEVLRVKGDFFYQKTKDLIPDYKMPGILEEKDYLE